MGTFAMVGDGIDIDVGGGVLLECDGAVSDATAMVRVEMAVTVGGGRCTGEVAWWIELGGVAGIEAASFLICCCCCCCCCCFCCCCCCGCCGCFCCCGCGSCDCVGCFCWF